jgi:hypothetical protein
MNISKFLGKVIGIYFLITSLAMLLNMPQFITNINNLSSSLVFVIGFFTLILGILLVVGHNFWEGGVGRIIITIIGWITLIKGITMFFFPHTIDAISISFTQNVHIAYTSAIIEFILALFLIYYGYKDSSFLGREKGGYIHH